MQTIETAAHRPLEASLPNHGVSALESHHARDFQMETARHDFFQLLYVLRGQGELHCEIRDFSLESGDVALLPTQSAHAVADSKTAPLSIYAVNLAPRFLCGDLAALAEKPRRLRHSNLQSALPDLLRRLLLEQTLQKPGFEAMMGALASQLLVSLLRAQNAPSEPLETPSDSKTRLYLYLQELERSFYHPETLGSAALKLGLSRRRFTSLFREVAGTSWLAHLRKLRVAHAQTLLQSADRTVLAIAFECGFEDVSSFYRAFKSETGRSPDSWRKNQG